MWIASVIFWSRGRIFIQSRSSRAKESLRLPSGAPMTRIAAIASGQMDATIVPPENLAAVEKAGLKALKDLSEMDAPIQHTGLVVRRSFLKEHRPLSKAFLAA